MTDRAKEVLLAAQRQLRGELEGAIVHTHPTARGSATEHGWGRFLDRHLPKRYEVTQGFVIDADGRQSEQLDIILCDRHYTTVLLDDRAARYVPAESVYAVFEVKQNLNKTHVEDAQAKVRSVRALRRSSAPIQHAGGTFAPKVPGRILGGLLATRSDWTPPFGDPFVQAVLGMTAADEVDFFVALADGAAEVKYGAGAPTPASCRADVALPWFFLTLVHRLQELATVVAADYLAYRSAL